MNLVEIHWDRESYQTFLSYLDSLTDEEYLKFHKGLVLDGLPMRGIRTPILKEIAKKISKGDYLSFLEINQFQSYEEIILYGLVLANTKLSFDALTPYLDIFISKIDNWAINDIVAASLKIFKKEPTIGYQKILDYLQSTNEWSVRFGLVLLLDHFINDEYIDKVLAQVEQVTLDTYYVKMANAWLISVCYIKYPLKTNTFLEQTSIDSWTYNKAISKICDSYRVSKEDKEKLKRMKR